ncbi:hypothetical protein LACWKB8_1620 [Lactobacillus sp. wkB8]|nr:hypothetical protein LACWKB8_1620 [Lactobacillus sp. wkB8]
MVQPANAESFIFSKIATGNLEIARLLAYNGKVKIEAKLYKKIN